MVEVDLFPVKCFLLHVPTYEDILEEARSHKEAIRAVSFSSGKTWHENHFTDFSNTVPNKAFESAIKAALTSFHDHTKFSVSITEYWTSFYGSGAMHEPHVHSVSLFDKVNYSGILYLTPSGGTQLFSNHSLSVENTAVTNGNPGDLFLFPASIPHTFAKDTDSEEDRVVIAFNLHVYGAA